MKNTQISNDIDIKARISDLIADLENIPSEAIEIFQVTSKLRSILARCEDAQFEIACNRADNA